MEKETKPKFKSIPKPPDFKPDSHFPDDCPTREKLASRVVKRGQKEAGNVLTSP